MIRAILIVALLAQPALASNRYRSTCHNGYCAPIKKVVAAPVVYPPQTIIQNQNILYPVGANLYSNNNSAIIQAESLQLQREMSRIMDRYTAYQQQAANQPQTIVLRVEAAAQVQQATTHCVPEATAPTFNQTQNSILSQTCMKCHSGSNAKGDFHLDRELTCDDKLLAISMVVAGEMPPKSPLTREQSLAVLQELAQLPTSNNNSQHLPTSNNNSQHLPTNPPQPERPPQDQPQAPPIPPQDPPSDRPSLQPPKDPPGDFSGITPEVMQKILSLVPQQRKER